MQINSQPWIHSWYGDLFGLHLVPMIFALLAWLRFPPFDGLNPAFLGQLVFAVLIIDWAHIFAQWYRIYSNPVEKARTRRIYFISYLLLIPIIATVLHFDTRLHINIFLIYFVVFHFIKQAFGFIKIYSRIDGSKTRFENSVETVLIYSTMVCPVIYWHITFPSEGFTWAYFFFKNPIIHHLFYPSLGVYLVSLLCYLFFELKRWREKNILNLPKNLALAAAAIGWGVVSLLPDSKVLVMFTVILTHDLAYTFFVWFVGRRDAGIMQGKVPWLSWWSIPGFLIYLFAIIIISHPLMVLHLEMGRDMNIDYWLIGKIFNEVPSEAGWWQNFGWAIFFATQGHHYFIDRYLWKKEKDLNYMVNTGKFQIEKKV